MAEPTKLTTFTSAAGAAQSKAPLEELLEASKDAERLISCFFDLHAIEGEPFQGIWDRLAKAIQRAHGAVGSGPLTLDAGDDERSFVRRPI